MLPLKIATQPLSIIIAIALLVSISNCIQPTAPIAASPNTQSSPSNLIVSFSLANSLATSAYAMVVLPFYPSSLALTPESCTLLNSLTVTTTSCANLFTASASSPNPLTVNTTAVSNINPNIQSNLTIVMSFSSTLAANTPYSIQIRLQDNLPSIGALSQSFEMYTISGTGVMLQQNWNMGQVFLQLKNNNLMTLVSINSEVANLPGSTVSSLLIDVTVVVPCPTPLSTFLFTISGNYQFTVSSLVTSIAVAGTPPQIQSTTVVSPNIIRVVFNEQFTTGRQFRLTISNLLNPLEISQGAVSLYSLPYNSISPLQVSELSIPFQTASYAPLLNLYTAQGITPSAPMLFYMDTQQYLTLTIQLPRIFDPSFVLQVASDVLVFQQGTIYVRTSTVNSNSLVYSLPLPNTTRISGFASIPSGSLITITMRAEFGSSPIFNMYVSIDTLAHLALAAPIIYGTVSATVSAIPVTYISNFMGSTSQTNKLAVPASGTTSFSFSVTPLFQTYTGSFLQIYTSPYLVADLTFDGASSCLVNSVAQTCSITSTAQYTVITIASSTSYNLFPTLSTTTVQVSQINLNYASSHSLRNYHFYFQLTVSLASQAAANLFLVSPMVVPLRVTSPGSFQPYFSNNIYSTGTNYLNVVRLVSSDTSQWLNTIQVNQKRIISIFAYRGWSNLFTTLPSYSTYPCASNINVVCSFIQGHNSNLSPDFPLNWDRIHILLPGTESTSMFSIVLPTQYLSTSQHLFEVLIGYIDTNNGAITYLQAGQLPVSGATTYLQPVFFAPTTNPQMPNKPKQTSMQLNIAGLAGSYQSSVNLTVVPSALFSASSYSACLILVSTWNFFDSHSALANASLLSANPTFANVEQAPLSLQIGSSSYLTVIPLKTSGTYTSIFNTFFYNLKLPYNLDLPYYSVTLVDGTGAVDGYNEFINQNQNVFYTGVMNNLAFTCNDNSLGVTNTYCTVQFATFQDIEVASVLTINLFGLYVSTNLCSLTYTSNPNNTVPVASCTPSTNLNVLTVTLANSARLPGLTNYTLQINGMSIDASSISNYITFQLMDPTGSYIIQTKTSILTTSVGQNFPIYITQVNFAFNNPVVTSSLFLNFTLPRPLNNDEAFALVLSKDFITLNDIPSQLYIRLLQADGVTPIPVSWVMKFINSQIVFEGLQSVLAANTYSLQLYGITTPSTVTQDMIQIIYLRIYDNSYTKTNTAASTATFPSLAPKVSSLITLQTYFNTEGLEHELTFTVVNQFAEITQNTIWVISLPIYYSKNVWNDDFLIYCTISGTPLTCARSPYTPYQITLSASPLLIPTGTNTYTITVYGIPCPRATYLNGNSRFVTQNIFFAMATSPSATAYADYSELFVSNTIINPMTASGYGSLILQSATSSNLQVYQSTFFTITLKSSCAIPAGSWIFITFPPAFDNFNNIPMVVQTQYSLANFEVSTNSSVVNTRVGYKLTTLSLPANTPFQIMITSLLTPKSAVTVDMNQLRILVSTSDRLSTIATSIQSRNQLGSLTFIPNALHLVVNNYQPISVTAGTYSSPILIKPSDNSTFLTNMLLTFSASSLAFNPSPLYLYLGTASSPLIIGADQNLIPTTYTFNLAKKETSISAYYSTLSEYAVFVTSVPIAISFPATFTVPLGGCSLPTQITIPNPPYSSVTVNLQYNTTLAPPGLFWVNQEISFEQVQFDINNTQRWVSFCSSPAFTPTAIPVTLNLGGDNAASYNFTPNYTTVNIVNAPSLNVVPTFSIVASNIQKTFAAIQITTNAPGYFYYEIMIAPMTNFMTLPNIRTYVKFNQLTLQSNTDYLTQIYTGDRDQRVGYAPATAAGINSFSINNLLPERTYTLCGYFQTQFGSQSSSQCITFTMQAWGVVSKAYVSFSSTILANALNNVLCFFVKASNSQINQIIDLQGNSCSLNTSPQNYFYNYKGNTTTNQYVSTIIYHTANLNLTTDASISAFNALFDTNGITASALSLAQTQFSINFISASKSLGTFQPMAAITASTPAFQPQVSLTINNYVSSSYKISLTGIVANVPSSVYFILVSYKNITTNQITSQTTITIRPLVAPTADQIASCTDGTGSPAVQCQRVVMQAGATYSFAFTNIVENSVYVVYYTYANEYPERPVFYGNVQTKHVFTVNFENNTQFLIAILLIVLAMII